VPGVVKDPQDFERRVGRPIENGDTELTQDQSADRSKRVRLVRWPHLCEFRELQKAINGRVKLVEEPKSGFRVFAGDGGGYRVHVFTGTRPDVSNE
jgi:hypothetical protein